MATRAQRQFCAQSGAKSLNPFELAAPGDVLRTLSQDIEWKIFQGFEHKVRSVAIIKEVLGGDPAKTSVESVFKGIIGKFSEINAIMLSAAQQRKSRAGYSMEHHLGRMLTDGAIPHQAQVVLSNKGRPDFILPTVKLFNDPERRDEDALILSAKSTLRERWKQVPVEMKSCELYLATFDASISANAIDGMAKEGIRLVVPESLKNSKETVYAKRTEIVSFDEFFRHELRDRRFPIWKKLGLIRA